MRRDIAEKCRACISCQQTKITRHQVTPLQHFRTPDARFSYVHVDIVGPLPDSSGYKYLLTVVDRFTRWPEAIPMKDITAQSCADSFLLHWVARFGSPTIITTDRGAQFTSLLWTEMCQFLGSKLCHTTAFHPAANGLNERFNRSLKVALKCQSSPDLWYRNLSLVLLGLRSAIKEDGAVNSLRLILLEVILTNQFVFLFKQKTKIFVYQILTNYFFNFKLNLKHLIQIENQIKSVELKTN